MLFFMITLQVMLQHEAVRNAASYIEYSFINSENLVDRKVVKVNRAS